ncbi:MAG: DNA-processing protein DprA [Oscillospiraceae bacterium]|nr:DNA-processing protein DprA [Oscillospiraceae bacterium]
MTSEYSIEYFIWLSSRSGIGNMRAKLLLDYFGSPKAVYDSTESELRGIYGLDNNLILRLIDKDLKPVEKIFKLCDKTGCMVLSMPDAQYPERLRNIYDPPLVLYVKGTLPAIDEFPTVGIVGTRNCTQYGLSQAEKAGLILSQNNIIVVTGLAKGVDAAASIGAVKGNTPSIAVVGTGLDTVYPAENKPLFNEILKNGAVISEYPPGTKGDPFHFPLRNRIISGISVGVAVIEAPLKSGALITAQRAVEQGRDVFVLPGNVDSPACMGSNKLLRVGAIPFLTAFDIIDEYKDLFGCVKKPIDNGRALDYIGLDTLANNFSGDDKAVADSIGKDPILTDEIIAKTGLAAQNVLMSLTSLELAGYIKRNIYGKWEIVG